VTQGAPVGERAGRDDRGLAQAVAQPIERLRQAVLAPVLLEQLGLRVVPVRLECGDTHSQQPQRPAPPVGAPQRASALEDEAMVVGVAFQRALPGDGHEVLVAQPQGHGPADEALAAQAPGHLVGQPQQRSLEEGRVG
jgi:hypothetical protein